ncbi:MAG TPA: hypothetical protein VKB86_16240, partial [Pyrinomonadaceae bacterium]|nr:hypothetical protein [Pyrinomonadaceae bacterium]
MRKYFRTLFQTFHVWLPSTSRFAARQQFFKQPLSAGTITRSVASLLAMFLILLAQTAFAQDDVTIKPPTVRAARSSSKPPAEEKQGRATAGTIASVLEPNRSPLVTFRILFMTGTASD